MSNKDRSKQEISKSKQNKQVNAAQDNNRDDMRSTNLHDSPMMAYLLDALEQGQDIGHFGRLTFVMVARFFLSDEELLDLIVKQPGMDEKEARALILQVKQRGYNPPKRERILQWSEQQDFPICPTPEDLNGCNVYRELKFPDEIYEQIDDFWEEKAEAESQAQDEQEM